MDTRKPILLIIEDDFEIADMLEAYFSSQSYFVLKAGGYDEGLANCLRQPMDVIVVNAQLAGPDGRSIVYSLRDCSEIRHTPFVCLVDSMDYLPLIDEAVGQMDTVIHKPFDINALSQATANALEWRNRAKNENPLTGLPDGLSVRDHLCAWLDKEQPGSLLVVSVENVVRFREYLGYKAALDLIKAIAVMIKSIVSDVHQFDFVGHLDQTVFLIDIPANSVNEIKGDIISKLEKSFEYFYNEDQSKAIKRQRFLPSIRARVFLPMPGIKLDIRNLYDELEALYR